jgi:hypothetical protein
VAARTRPVPMMNLHLELLRRIVMATALGAVIGLGGRWIRLLDSEMREAAGQICPVAVQASMRWRYAGSSYRERANAGA